MHAAVSAIVSRAILFRHWHNNISQSASAARITKHTQPSSGKNALVSLPQNTALSGWRFLQRYTVAVCLAALLHSPRSGARDLDTRHELIIRYRVNLIRGKTLYIIRITQRLARTCFALQTRTLRISSVVEDVRTTALITRLSSMHAISIYAPCSTRFPHITMSLSANAKRHRYFTGHFEKNGKSSKAY